ncbi:MAG: endonuclease/exonuclease/phosphatase family protein [Saprospiraceae bacterium]|nr:endonuclease/exonuclease/phosphatase family protein [Saprospiraceae bacterium]
MTFLSFNTALLNYQLFGMPLFRPVRYVEKRLFAMAAELQRLNADIISLQEVYSLKHKQYLTQTLQSLYPFSFYDTKSRWGQLGSGLMILSKLPIVHSTFETYKHQPLEERWVTQKGLLSVIVQTVKGRLVLTNTHTTASGSHFKQESPHIESVRQSQIVQTIASTHRLKRDWACAAAFICGDFNCSPEIAPRNYACIAQHGFVDLYKKVNNSEEPTWDTDNPLNCVRSFFKTSPKQRIDFILSEVGYEQLFSYLRAKIVLKERCVQIHAQSYVPLSDHYGIMTELK